MANYLSSSHGSLKKAMAMWLSGKIAQFRPSGWTCAGPAILWVYIPAHLSRNVVIRGSLLYSSKLGHRDSFGGHDTRETGSTTNSLTCPPNLSARMMEISVSFRTGGSIKGEIMVRLSF